MPIKDYLKLLLFFAGLIFLNNRLTDIFAFKNSPFAAPNLNSALDNNWLSTMRNGFYNEKPDNIDVVFVGSSQIFCNINPNIIWDQYGITSYDFSAHLQEPGISYYYLKQVFETQSPKVAVVDLYLNGDKTVDEYGNMYAHYNFDYMKKDIYRLRAIWERTKSNRMELFFPIILYHQRWKELTGDEVLYRPSKHDFLKGSFLFMSDYYGNRLSFIEKPDVLPEYTLSEQTIYWLNAINDLCQKNGCECLFIKTPILNADYDFYTDSDGIEYLAYLNALTKYCEENNLSFLNLDAVEDEIGLFFETDYIDNLHLNWNGQQKLSAYLGNYLMETYDLENRKGEPGFEQWDEDYKNMRYYTDNFWEIFFGTENEDEKDSV